MSKSKKSIIYVRRLTHINPSFNIGDLEPLASNESEADYRYFELEIEEIPSIKDYFLGNGFTMVTARDLSKAVIGQRVLSDRTYQEAVENNYSHETLTPLNCIINTSGEMRG